MATAHSQNRAGIALVVAAGLARQHDPSAAAIELDAVRKTARL